MSVRLVAREHYRRRSLLARGLERLAALLWGRVDRDNVADSWAALVPTLAVQLTAAQRAAAAQADTYLAAVLAEQGLGLVTAGRVNVDALTGVASDGRDLTALLNQPSLTALTALSRGYTVDRAVATAGATVQMIVGTQVADAGRAADAVSMVAHRGATGYRRMMVGESCSRCVILAGRWYATTAGFDRHPKCDCIHVPGAEDTADDVRTDPKAYFRSLSTAEQDRIFTKAGAEAIRLGANPNQVVNARRGARGLTPAGARITGPEAQILRGGRTRGRLQAQDVYGRQLLVTSEGVTVRGVAGIRLGTPETGTRQAGQRYRSAGTPRLMPESILQIAGDDREEAVRLLRRFGYIL